MKHTNKVEVILFSKYTFGSGEQKELVRWLGTTLQETLLYQRVAAKRFFLKTLKDTSPIFLS